MSFNLSMDMSIVLIWPSFKLGVLLYQSILVTHSTCGVIAPKGKTTAFKCGVFSNVKANVQ